MRASRVLSVLLIAALAITMLPMNAMGAVKAQSAPVGTEFQITFEEHSQNQEEFWGDTVVYADHRNSQVRVYGTKLGGSEFPVSITTGTQNNPSVYGDYVVYMKKRMVWVNDDWDDVGDIWGYKISTGENFPICTDDEEQGNPFIWGNKVAWIDYRNEDDDARIYVYDLATGTTQIIMSPSSNGDLYSPSMYEDYLLTLEYYGGGSRLRLFDLTDGSSVEVPDSAGWYEARSPNVWGDWVVWQMSSDVMAYNIVSEETTVVCDTGSGQGVDVWNGLVVWEDTRNSSSDIFMMNLETSEETTICANDSNQGRPRIDNATVVWTDERASDETGIDNADIWGMYLAPQVTELAGDTRYETAVMASRAGFGLGAETVIVATGENWPDALAASGLAGAAGGPVLLTMNQSVPAVVAAEVQRLGAVNAYLIGGTNAVSAGVEAYLSDLLPGDVVRIGGADRYATAAMVSEEAVSLMGTDTVTAILASGINSPDAVSSSAMAAGLGMPLYLTKQGELPANVKTAMTAAGVNDVYVVGGTSAISDSVKSAVDASFGTVERLYGADRYATSVAIAEKGVDLGLTWDGVGFALGTKFPDALAGGVVQGRMGSVLLLTAGDALNSSTSAALEANKADIGLVRFYGGTAAISDNVRDAIEAIINS